MATVIRSIKFWINAFIPRDIPGYTMTVPKGRYAGFTMIPGPQSVGVPIPPRPSPYMMYQGVSTVRVGTSDCYLTDQRTFSSNINEKSRMHSEVKVDFSSPTPLITQWHNCDFTTECDCEDGDVECHKPGKTSRMGFFPISVGPRTTIRMDCAASNPCAPTSRLFGDIDYEGTIVFDKDTRTIQIDILIDRFPAFEAYATINDGPGTVLFREAPPIGNTVMNLPGRADRPIRRSLKDRTGSGIFEMATSSI